MENIQSKENLLIKEVKKLKEKRYRKDCNMFLVEGFRFVEEALDSDFEVVHIFISTRGESKYEDSQIKNKLQKDTKVYCINDSIFKDSAPPGISNEIYDISDLKVKIPMPGGAESLNVAVAASIMMYEVVRQKNNI